MITAKEAKEMRDVNFKSGFPTNWLELALDDINDRIVLSTTDFSRKKLTAVWKCVISKFQKTFCLSESQIKKISDELLNYGYQVEEYNLGEDKFLEVSYNVH